MELAVPKKQSGWPAPRVHATENTTQQQQILKTRDILMDIKEFTEKNPKRKAGASYVHDLSCSVLGLIESLVASPILGDDLKEFIKQTKAAADENKQLSALLRSRIGAPGASTSTATTGYKDTQRWIKEGIASSLSTLFPSAEGSPSTPALPVDDKELRIRVRVMDQAVRSNLRIATEVEGLDRVNEAIHACPELHPIKIVSFTQLQSGDAELRCEKVSDVERLTHNQEAWTKVYGPGAHILIDTYSVVLHGIQVTSIKAHQEKWTNIATVLLADNSAHFPAAKVVHMGWLVKRQARVKAKSSVIVAFTDPVDANRAIASGMTWAGSHHVAEYYEPNCKLQQCHKCQHYGHVGTRCHASIKCAKCAAAHTQSQCPYAQNPQKYLCAVCNGPHSALDPECPTRQKAIQATLNAKANMPAFHPVPYKNPDLQCVIQNKPLALTPPDSNTRNTDLSRPTEGTRHQESRGIDKTSSIAKEGIPLVLSTNKPISVSTNASGTSTPAGVMLNTPCPTYLDSNNDTNNPTYSDSIVTAPESTISKKRSNKRVKRATLADIINDIVIERDISELIQNEIARAAAIETAKEPEAEPEPESILKPTRTLKLVKPTKTSLKKRKREASPNLLGPSSEGSTTTTSDTNTATITVSARGRARYPSLRARIAKQSSFRDSATRTKEKPSTDSEERVSAESNDVTSGDSYTSTDGDRGSNRRWDQVSDRLTGR